MSEGKWMKLNENYADAQHYISDLKERIAELEAELAALRAERWEPVEDGIVDARRFGRVNQSIEVEDDQMTVEQYWGGEDVSRIWYRLPDNMRLCRKEARNE